MAMISEVVRPKRYVGVKVTRQTTATPIRAAIFQGTIRGTTTSGSRTLCSDPRAGSRLPKANRMIITSRNGST
jgi:hypothetical protein